LSSGIQCIVGLANPGERYAHTRHNAGAWFVEQVVKEAHMALRPEAKYHGLYALALFESPCHLLIPTTFMNHSGQAVRACLSYYKIPPQTVLVAHDDIDLPIGTIKLKYDGGDGGHHGLKDIIQHLHTKQFYRLRIGIGHPSQRQEVIHYVLSPPSVSERQKINQALQQAQEIIPLLLSGHIQQAMQQLHTRA
jgi:peptidyl-tRNA hydrolase, PTH1 family